MAEPFVAEIRIMPFDFAPRGWAFCSGDVMAIDQHTTLFTLLGTTYGGDGETTFALPNLNGKSPLGEGVGIDLSVRELGGSGGESSVTLVKSEMPFHIHVVQSHGEPGDLRSPQGNSLAVSTDAHVYGRTADALLDTSSVKNEGGGMAHNNMQPYLTLSFCIALLGVVPERP